MSAVLDTLPELRIPPHSIQAEQSLLGGLMLDNRTWDQISDQVGEQDFYRRDHRLIFNAIARLAADGQPFDIVTLAESLETSGELDDAGGLSYLGNIVKETPSAANILGYARIVADRARDRRVLQSLMAGMDRIYTGGAQAADVAAVIRGEMEAIESSADPSGKHPLTFTAADLGRMEFSDPRWAVPNLLPEGLTILAGRPKMGKSWLSLAVAVAVACGGRVLGRIPVDSGDVLYLALEDRERRLRSRMDILLAGSPYSDRLHMATEWPRGDEGVAALRAWLTGHPEARLVVIDTLARFRAPSRGRGSAYDEDYGAVGAIQSMAVAHGVAVVLIHHLRKMGSDDPMDQISGTMGVSGAADALLVLARERGDADAVLHVTGRDLEDAEHALRWDSPTCTWAIMGAAAEYRMSQERREILDALKSGPAFPKTLAAVLDKSQGAVRKLLHTMHRDGQVECNGTLYHLPVGGNSGNSSNTGNTGNGGNGGNGQVSVTGVTGSTDSAVTPETQQRRGLQPGVTGVTTVTMDTDDGSEAIL